MAKISLGSAEKIYRAGLKLLTPLTLDEEYRTIAKEAIGLVKGDEVLIFTSKDDVLSLTYSTTQIVYKFKKRKRGFTYKTFRSGVPQILSLKQVAKFHPEFKTTKTKEFLLVPLTNRGKTIGVLTVISNKENFFKEKDLNILILFSPLASLAVRKTQLYNEVKEALEVRDRFISMASHELRTPLTSVNGYIQLLRSKFNGKDTQEARWLEGLSSETLRLTLLVKELLETNRINSGQLLYYLKEVHLKDAINRAISGFEFTYPNRKLLFIDNIPNKDDIVIADFDKLLQVINNLLENAAKYSPSDREINLKLSYRFPSFVITIEDKGVGIDKSDLNKVFDGFYRGSNIQKEGLGLGLFLVKDIVTRLNGSINITSKLNKGTKVEVKLPKHKYE